MRSNVMVQQVTVGVSLDQIEELVSQQLLVLDLHYRSRLRASI